MDVARGFGTLLARLRAGKYVSNGKHLYDRKRVGGLGLSLLPLHPSLRNDDTESDIFYARNCLR